MPSNGLTVIARVKPGCETALREILNRIGNDINGKRVNASGAEPHIFFTKSRSLHFARLVLLDDPDAGPGRQRLMFASDYDGDWREHVAEVFNLTNDPDAIWGCCEGYHGKEHFSEFLRSHSVEPQAYYVAFRGETVHSIRINAYLREQLEKWVSWPQTAAFTEAVHSLTNKPQWAGRLAYGLEKGVARVGRFLADVWRVLLVLQDAFITMARFGPLNAVLGAKRIIITLGRIPLIRLINRLTFNSMPFSPSPFSSVPIDTCAALAPTVPGDEVVSTPPLVGTPPPQEDVISQNQLTLIMVIRPERLRRLQAVLASIDIYARRLAPPGSLLGISTIHTVRWLIIDGGRRLLMVSNYDGTWENYIDEFAEMILSGLDAIWENTAGYPAPGAQDVAALKHFLRCHQLPSNVFFSAYPDTTVLNIIDNKKIVRGLMGHVQRLNKERWPSML